METAVVVAFPALSPVVDGWRERTCADDRPSIGIPPHVTLLHPFVPAEAVDDGSPRGARATVRRYRAVRSHVSRVASLAGMAYLAPEPPEPFSRLTAAIVERWPDYPPYEGIHETVIPHLTASARARRRARCWPRFLEELEQTCSGRARPLQVDEA